MPVLTPQSMREHARLLDELAAVQEAIQHLENASAYRLAALALSRVADSAEAAEVLSHAS